MSCNTGISKGKLNGVMIVTCSPQKAINTGKGLSEFRCEYIDLLADMKGGGGGGYAPGHKASESLD